MDDQVAAAPVATRSNNANLHNAGVLVNKQLGVLWSPPIWGQTFTIKRWQYAGFEWWFGPQFSPSG